MFNNSCTVKVQIIVRTVDSHYVLMLYGVTVCTHNLELSQVAGILPHLCLWSCHKLWAVPDSSPTDLLSKISDLYLGVLRLPVQAEAHCKVCAFFSISQRAQSLLLAMKWPSQCWEAAGLAAAAVANCPGVAWCGRALQ